MSRKEFIPASQGTVSEDIAYGARVAVNKMAMRVIAPGTHYERPISTSCGDDSDTPIPIISGWVPNKNQPECVDWTGTRIGRLVVVGLGIPREGRGINAPGRWVCKCDCGRWTTRVSASIRRGNRSMCGRCAMNLHLRKVDAHMDYIRKKDSTNAPVVLRSAEERRPGVWRSNKKIR